jgi:signal transduction histidine kinase
MEANHLLGKSIGADSLIALNYIGAGINFTNMGTYDSAFFYFQKARAIYDKLDNKRMEHVVDANMAQAYYNKREPKKAMEIIGKLASDSINKTILLTILHLKANILGSGGKLNSAIAVDRRVIRKYGQEKNNYQLSSFYNNLGLCFLGKGMTDSALYYCRKSYQIDSLSGIKMNMGANLILLGDIHRRSNEKKQALDYYKQALKIFSEDRNVDKKYWVFEMMANVARQDNDLKQLVSNQDSMLIVFGRMNSLNVNRTIELLKIEYETEKKDRQIDLQDAQLKSQRRVIVLTVIIFLLVLTALYFIFQNRHKLNKLRIADQDRRVSVMLVETEQNERSRIARDLHDSVSQKLAVMGMHLSLIETTQTEAVDNVTILLQQAIADVRGISHNLYPKDLEKGILPALEHLCEQNNFANHGMGFSLKTDEAVRKVGLSKNIELVLFRIVQELTNNALKYSKATEVYIELGLKDGKIALHVADNGIGFDSAHLENAKGIGLKNMMDRIRQIGGKVDIQSHEGEGTRFIIEIPA